MKTMWASLKILHLSFRRKPESSNFKNVWIPTFVGMTFLEVLLCLLLPVTLSAAETTPPVTHGCLVPAKTPVFVCETGGSFLCVNTPLGSVKEDFVIIKGRLNLETSNLGQLTIATQHEYTKQLKNISLTSPMTEDCWNASLSPEKNFCLEKSGAYAVRIPLDDLGPYTLFIAATRLQGESAQTTSRVSRVIKPTVTEDVITYDPNINEGQAIKATHHVRVVLDLLAGCGESKEACDFIGAGTGGVFVTVENRMATTPPKTVRCETNSIQGGVGRFALGVPVEPGANQLTIRICNAATGFNSDTCPKIISRSFNVGGTASQIQILPPFADGPFLWDQTKNSTIPLRFKIEGVDGKKCEDNVHVSLNSNALPKVCANAEGVYEISLNPEVGYNIVSVEASLPDQKLTATFPFGWGKPFSPFDPNGNVRPDNELNLSHAMQFWLSEGFFNQTLMPPLQSFIASEKFKTWLGQATENVGRGEAQKKDGPANPPSLPSYCKSGGLTGLRMKVTQSPQIGRISVTPLQFAESQAQLSLHAEDLSVGIQLYKDENNDGVPDIDPLPLKIVFKQLDATPILQNGGVLSSPYTDCDYKRSGACLHMPALLVPQHFKGGASPSGAFVTCDRSQKISEKMDQICHAMNVVDRQTGGFLQEKILDTLNNAYACQGAGAVTGEFPIAKEFAGLIFKGAVGLEGLEIHKTGMTLSAKTRFGNQEILGSWPESIRKRGAGILLGSGPARPLIFSSDTNDVSFGFSLPMISQLFWGLKIPDGSDGLVIDDNFFKKMGFDFSTICDGTQQPGSTAEPNPLCNIRPRAQEILGDPISKFGYLDPRAPLRLIFKPSEAFPLRLNVLEETGLLQMEFADWELAIESSSTRFIVAKLSAKIGLQVLPLEFNAADPSSLRIGLKIVAEKSHFWMTEKEGTNTTIIPGPVLLSKLEQILKLAIDNYSKAGKEIRFPIPRGFDFSTIGFGLPRLVWGANGFDLGWDASANRLLLHSVPVVK